MDLHRVDGVNGADEHQVTLYEYDGRNLVTKEINAAGGNTLYVYDGNGNMVSKTDGDGYVTEYSYNSPDLVSHISYNGAKEVTYQYNKVGELVKMDDWLGTTTFELDLLSQLKKVTDHKGNVVEYTYDEVGNQTNLTYPDKSTVSSSYDALGQLTQTTDGDGGKYTYTYDDAGNVTKLTYPNGWVEEYSYDAEGNLLKTVDTDPFHNNKKSTKYQYTYDAEGNLVTEFQRDSDGEAGLVANTTYTYDALNRLTGSKKVVERTRKTYAKTYAYDSLGNLVQENGPDGRDQTTYQYNRLNQMVARKECSYVQSITRIHDYGYTYDGRGNLIKEEICSPTTQGPKNITIATYTYDETGKMVSGTNKDGEVSNYTFNGLGVRVGTEVIVKDNTHGYTDFHCQTPTVETGIDKPEVVLSDYVIDYTRLNIDQRVLVKSETDGYDFRYTYGLDLVNVKATGEGTSWWAQSVKKCVYSDYVHTDRLGSVVNLTDQYGRVPAQIDYDEWGKVTAYQSLNISGGYRTVLPEITYAGHQYDDVLGMYYAKARMYDAENRRFASVDPVKGRITEPMSMVQYLYVVDNPLRWVDKNGLYYIFLGNDGQYYAAPENEAISGLAAATDELVPLFGSSFADMIRGIQNKDAVSGNSLRNDKNNQATMSGFISDLNEGYLSRAWEESIKKVFGEVASELTGVLGTTYSIANLLNAIRDATQIPQIDAIVFNLLSMAGIVPKSKDLAELEIIMASATIFVQVASWLFLEPSYTNITFNIGTPQYSGGPTLFSMLMSLKKMYDSGQSEEKIRKEIDKYYSNYICASLKNATLQNLVIEIEPPQMKPIYRPPFAEPVGYTPIPAKTESFVHYALYNYSAVIANIVAGFSSFVKSMQNSYNNQ